MRAKIHRQVEQISAGCQFYAADNGGRFPDQLTDLLDDQRLNAEKWFIDPRDGGFLELEYFGSGKTQDDIRSGVLIRIVLDKEGDQVITVDGYGETDTSWNKYSNRYR